MDIDDGLSAQYPLQPTNALAGPSTVSDVLPPPALPQPPPYFTSTQDLVARFKLAPAYDKYVRPYVTPVSTGGPPTPPGATDKGKGKEKEHPPREPPDLSATPAAHDGDEEDSKGEKKWKNNYKHLIKGIPGKHSMKKDDYLTTMISVPPKQKMAITPFDLKTQREAFSVSLEGLKGWNINALVAESPQAREDRKKRKEMKKRAKAGILPATLVGTSTPSGFPATPAPTAAPTPGTAGGPARTATPRPRQPSGPHTSTGQARGRTPVGIGTPQSMSTPVSGPGPAAYASPPAVAPPPVVAHTPATMQRPQSGMVQELAVPKRGVKREREQTADGVSVNGTVPTQGAPGSTAKPLVVVGAKAGSAGVRPRPVKKQRMDSAGQAREMPVQQPTPHA
ncbi:hypothetical protein SCP_1302390 [Sparassis crispa]|uniref:Mediator of RNA polymerase II transcription subunit 19 n=1 Tax=Sparassis crispa TaxID=139825 RepID=A0A401H1Y1_9APHY|nr:hypothetical protein SCP_1302390 [Sparassis crispa]GBE88424.1 hypothetical protein SCP_1302390 [Sparassis crispa]